VTQNGTNLVDLGGYCNAIYASTMRPRRRWKGTRSAMQAATTQSTCRRPPISRS
jgi:hypothetical protein